jgi:hypothetical protein
MGQALFFENSLYFEEKRFTFAPAFSEAVNFSIIKQVRPRGVFS